MDIISIAEWREEGVRRFGDDPRNWKFRCPACGHVSSVADFMELGKTAELAYQECIGRLTGKGSPKSGDSSGCNWAAYGLFGTLGKGRTIVTEKGREIEVFDFADD